MMVPDCGVAAQDATFHSNANASSKTICFIASSLRSARPRLFLHN
jgi:hypothetical protein